MSDTPLFAIIGHPNEGKSSVVATLTENESISISATPGETTRCAYYDAQADGETVLRFVDTPGFQNPTRILAWLETCELTGAAAAQALIDHHSGQATFHHDCELMKPLAQGAGILYVVDASRPLSQVDIDEMEILRRIGLPRAAIINPKTANERNLANWKTSFRQHFNAIRVFNAHNASFTERISLLDTIKTIEQDWSPALENAISALQHDWKRRQERCVALICELLEDALRYSKSKLIANESESEHQQEILKAAYAQGLAKRERRIWHDMQNLYRHKRLKVDIPENSLLGEDLFSDRTWQALGLTQSQLAWTAAAVGAGIGVGLDTVFGGLTFGIFTATGAAVAGGSALIKGRELASLKINRIPIGGLKLSIGPNRNEQFPFILLDRILLFHSIASNWAHARQDNNASPEDNAAKHGATSKWSDPQRKLAASVFSAIKTNKREKLDRLYPEFRTLLLTNLS